jgi:hypothetical protein
VLLEVLLTLDPTCNKESEIKLGSLKKNLNLKFLGTCSGTIALQTLVCTHWHNTNTTQIQHTNTKKKLKEKEEI